MNTEPTPPAPLPVPPNPNVAATKQHRKDLDEVLQRLRRDSDHGYTGIRDIAITKIQEAIMWLGMDLKAMNEPNPYPHSYDPTSPAIEPTADGLKL